MTPVFRALVGAAILGAGLPAMAAPWLDPGDIRARYSAQKLADRGAMNRTTSTWPLMWGNLEQGYQNTRASAATPDTTLNYLKFERKRQAERGFRAEASLASASEGALIQGFNAGPQDSGQAGLTLEWIGNHWALGLSPSFTQSPDDDDEVRADGSYLAFSAGNWVFGVGSIERWWGPGWQSSLILSNNARPIPSVWINRRNATAPQSNWLSWIGPWDATAFLGELEGERTVPDPKVLGVRLTLRPLQGLDIGFSRLIMLGGKGYPESSSTYWNALIGRDNGQLEENDPGDQLGAVDIRYGMDVGATTLGVYTQMMGEDEAGAFPARKSWLFGADAATHWFSAEQQWFVEYSNTIADDFNGDAIPNITYSHSRYNTGQHYYGRTMAASQGGDARMLTLGGWHFLTSGTNLGARLSHVELNTDGETTVKPGSNDVRYFVPRRDQSVTHLALNLGTQVAGGWLSGEASYSDAKIETLSGKIDQWRIAAQWRYRF
ncbi:capsule assembly Wzi family protein [Salicola sp. Rm-C-2C1-2]|uniref:capsule assembly Wzi family protein n=1 Tax=Salicola sp. Rm-C-2C1-2 TaxID=3141321 RepID=UPI0032E489BD